MTLVELPPKMTHDAHNKLLRLGFATFNFSKLSFIDFWGAAGQLGTAFSAFILKDEE